jgi:hypothetical protein
MNVRRDGGRENSLYDYVYRLDVIINPPHNNAAPAEDAITNKYNQIDSCVPRISF